MRLSVNTATVRRVFIPVLGALALSASAGATAKPTLDEALLKRPTPVQLQGIKLVSIEAIPPADQKQLTAGLKGMVGDGVAAKTSAGVVAWLIVDNAADAEGFAGLALSSLSSKSGDATEVLQLPAADSAFAFPNGAGWANYGRVLIIVEAVGKNVRAATQLLAFAVAHARAAEASG